MARQPTILQSDFPYNISARCINREWFNLPMDKVWKIFCEQLTETSDKHHLKIHSFVLMTNHFHLIASTPEANLSECMQNFMQKTSLRIARSGNRINETFAGRYYKGILQCHNYYLNAYKYNYRNPVTANICQRPEEYHFSTLQMVMKKRAAEIPLLEDTTYAFDPQGTVNWLNTTPDPVKQEAARRGFKHQYFRSKTYPRTKTLILSEHDLL